MSIYRYVKKYPPKRLKLPQKISVLFLFVGVAVIVWVMWPILSFQFFTSGLLAETITPLADNEYVKMHVGEVVQAADIDTAQIKAGDTLNPNDWYPSRPQDHSQVNISTYTLSIPKLNIRDAEVVIGGDALDKSLIHYGGTAVPGKKGTAVIFGHSSLPQLFRPKDFKTIFTFLPTLEPSSDTYIGDDIFINYEGVTFHYRVYDMKILKPTDLSVLEQKLDDSYLTLVTCVPPGTLWERLNVKAKLVRI